MFGYSALGTAALGTDGATTLEIAFSGVAAAGAAGAITGDHTSAQLSSTSAIGLAASLTLSQSISLDSASAISSIASLTANPEGLAATTIAITSVGLIASADGGQPNGAASSGAVAQLSDYLAVNLPGVSSATATANVIPGVSIAVGAFPVTSDGVLGLWTLGDAALGIDAPSETLFSGVAGSGVCSPMTMLIDNSVAAVGIAAPVVPDTEGYAPGSAALGLYAQLSIAEYSQLFGATAIGIAAALIADPMFAISGCYASGSAGRLSPDDVTLLSGVFASAFAGSGSENDPSRSISGCVATGAPGIFLSHSPSSAFAFWGTPVPGGSASVSFAGLPSVSMTVSTGQTTAQVASVIAALINSNSTLTTAGISARTLGNMVELHQPQPATISSSITMTGT